MSRGRTFSGVSSIRHHRDRVVHRDSYRKLAESGAETQVRFVWVDRDTEGSITRPLRNGISEKWDHFGLPSRAPELDDSVDELWLVYRQTRRGWRWTTNGWTALENV